MARAEAILQATGKRLDIGRFLPESIREKNEDGSFKEDYISIKKLPYSVKKKIEFISINNFSGKAGKAFYKHLKKTGVGLDKVDAMTEAEKTELMMDVIDNDESQSLLKLTVDLSRLVIENGVDTAQHTFLDTDNKPINLTYEFLEKIGNDRLIDFVVREIQDYSQGYVLGE